jgi:hypothetical protein
MVYSLTYRRPDYVPHGRQASTDSVQSAKTERSHPSEGSGQSLRRVPTPPGIPEALSFDKVIDGACCPPCTKRDFLNYLKYIERAPENLQFFLWYKDYQNRFDELPASEKALAPEWTESHVENERKAYRAELKKRHPNHAAEELLKETAFNEKTIEVERADSFPFNDARETTSRGSETGPGATSSFDDSSLHPTMGTKSVMSGHTQKTESAFEDAGLTQPFTIQPYREEISRILTVYIIDNSVRQLNLSGRERHALLKALEYTTHPSAFREVIANVEFSLRRQAHPNFIRWAICNGNRPRVIFARGLGVFLIVGAIVSDILLTLSKAARGWRALPIILFILGFATLFAAWKGMCVVLHGLHHQHVRPWELFTDHEADSKLEMESSRPGSVSIESLTGSTTNSFEDEPWVGKYKKRNLVRKVFDRERWIEEPALRQIQDTIFIQSLLLGTLASAILVAIFLAVPKGGFL